MRSKTVSADDMIFDIENPKDLKKKLQELIDKFCEVAYRKNTGYLDILHIYRGVFNV